MRAKIAAALAITALGVTACGGGAGNDAAPKLHDAPITDDGTSQLGHFKLTAEEVSDLAHDDDLFAGALVQQLAKSSGANLVLSPASVAIALQMLTAGARGATAAQLEAALHATGMSPAELTAAAAQLFKSLAGLSKQVTISNDLWAQDGVTINSSYQKDLQQGFDSAVHELNFNDATAAADTINAAIKADTHGHIPTIVTPDQVQGDLGVLTDAIYLQAKWQSPFDPSQTSPASFTVPGGSTVQAQTMHQTASWKYVAGKGFQAVTLPYQGGRLSMSVLLPSSNSSVAALESQAGRTGFDDLLSGAAKANVDLSLPRFELRTNSDLIQTLQALGVTDVFGTNANLSGISPQAYNVGWVQHNAWIKVTEKGTTAAAATAVGITLSAVRESPQHLIVMDVDRPFLVLIRDEKTGLPLFVAQVSNPS